MLCFALASVWFEKMLDAEVIRTMQQGPPHIDLKLGGANTTPLLWSMRSSGPAGLEIMQSPWEKILKLRVQRSAPGVAE